MEAHESRDGNRLCFAIQGRLDSNTSDGFADRLTAGLDGKPEALVIDCGGLEYMSSAGLRSLLMAAKRCRAEQIPLALYALRANVLEIFEMSGLLKVFPIFGDRAAAMASLGR